MKIVHIAANASFTEGFGYQENLLTKYQSRLGHEVVLFVQNKSRDNVEKKCLESVCGTFVSKDGFNVIVKKPFFLPIPLIGKLWKKLDVYNDLINLKPDFVFIHGLVDTTVFQVVRYKKKYNPRLVIVIDNHMDYNIGYPKKRSLKQSVALFINRLVYRLNNKYVSKVYGVTPWRQSYAVDVFGVPAEKTDVLIMGADDECLDFNKKEEIRNKIRTKYNVGENEFFIVTGGKIDKKKKIELLLNAVKSVSNVKILVFGSVVDSFKTQFDSVLRECPNAFYIGWVEGNKVYDYFFAADLVFFPGQHSVLWEQACASKVPCVFEKWDGMDHVNNGGNADFVYPVDVEMLKSKIEELRFTPKYFKMKAVAESEKTDIFLYSRIAKKSLECVKDG